MNTEEPKKKRNWSSIVGTDANSWSVHGGVYGLVLSCGTADSIARRGRGLTGLRRDCVFRSSSIPGFSYRYDPKEYVPVHVIGETHSGPIDVDAAESADYLRARVKAKYPCGLWQCQPGNYPRATSGWVMGQRYVGGRCDVLRKKKAAIPGDWGPRPCFLMSLWAIV